jgi:outer membrane protein OmpA-like peptidoglycan-associated protein
MRTVRAALLLGITLALAMPTAGARDEDGDGLPDSGLERGKYGDPEALAEVYFELGKWDLTTESRAILDSAARDFQRSAEVIEIGGHTDSSGEEGFNKNLSALRAQAVREYLVASGLGAARFTTVGYGKTQPVDSNLTAAGRSHNRRAALKAAAVAAN